MVSKDTHYLGELFDYQLGPDLYAKTIIVIYGYIYVGTPNVKNMQKKN